MGKKQPSARAKRADQKRYSKAEMNDRKETTKLKRAVASADRSFCRMVRGLCDDGVLKRITFSAKIRKMNPLDYTRKVLLK